MSWSALDSRSRPAHEGTVELYGGLAIRLPNLALAASTGHEQLHSRTTVIKPCKQARVLDHHRKRPYLTRSLGHDYNPLHA